ncbi:serologically defined colon cancer antigen 8 isoform X2 [Gopherus flavomarginatus]|uniref:serologically defined colon cancer antigen 8 isoform X2 n=1 Tax=Gopherus flavomarginatus TaxID=286002 RepID=UPI0021CBDC44|nr:serologically defined colon cancer antigen 8 isoform X2 [Gopherus flavomarginatus]XP_050806347.1 serologically defined colon cancer antigen 8 isoform X2 [Gopherus flavomarginatus]
MREAREESDLERYQRSLRDRASKSIHQLKYALVEGDPTAGESEVAFDQSSTGNDESWETAWQELQHNHAVNQLKALLREQEGLESEVSPSRRRRMSPSRTSEAADQSLPTLCDLVPIINDQSQYIHHLEAEVKFCKEELSGMKDRIRVVVLENEKLHEEMKSLTVEQTLREQTLLDASANVRNSWTVGGDDSYLCQPAKSSPSHNKEQVLATRDTAETEKWQLELEKLKLLYQERTDTLEAQVRSLRKDLSVSEKNCEDLKGRLKHQESLIATSNYNRVGGLCLKCAQHEAVLSQTHSNVHMHTIERLTKERDDLMSALVSVRRNLSEMQQRESSAYEQVKQAVQMTEEANLEKMKALVQCEQLKSEMERQKDRLERELIAQLDKRAGEKEALRGEMKKEREDLASTVMVLSQNVATLEARLERITREKNSIANQLEEAQNQLTSQEMEVNKVCGEMRFQLNQTKMKKDEAEKEHREYRTKTIRELEIKDQEIEKLGLELNENKLRLEQAQQDAARAKDECLKLTELLGKSEHQLHLTRLKKESIQHSFSNEAKTRALQAEQREQELTQKMQQMEAQHDKTVNELDSLLTSQNTFIAKLKEECCMLARKLEHVTEKNRSEVSQLSQENEYFHDRLEKMQKRNDELEEQCIQHGRMHERMKLRLHQLDKHCQTTAQQLVELLNKQNQLFRERQMLTEEVQFLRTQADRGMKLIRGC